MELKLTASGLTKLLQSLQPVMPKHETNALGPRPDDSEIPVEERKVPLHIVPLDDGSFVVTVFDNFVSDLRKYNEDMNLKNQFESL